MQIISRAEWGATDWTTEPAAVPYSERTEFYIHYDGGTPVTRTGNAVPQQIESEHLGNGWSGIGYHFVVTQVGEVYEGRGWDLQGAHCPGHNRSAFGVQIAIGGDQEPTVEALRAARALYETACGLVGHRLAMHGHRDGFNTECPGEKLYPWVQAGMPYPLEGSPAPEQPREEPASAVPAWPGRYLMVQSPMMRGGDVREWQQRMRDRGWRIDVDGWYGPASAAVARAFQAEKGLGVDGVVGPATWAAAWSAPVTD